MWHCSEQCGCFFSGKLPAGSAKLTNQKGRCMWVRVAAGHWAAANHSDQLRLLPIDLLTLVVSCEPDGSVLSSLVKLNRLGGTEKNQVHLVNHSMV